jgi:phage terminase Nu1 subunit (DNA packaging protein)
MPLSLDQLAVVFARDRRLVREWVDRGTIPRDAETAEQALLGAVNWFAKMRSGRHAEGVGGEVLDLAAERARLARAQSEGAELKNAELRGELVAASDVFDRWANLALSWKNRVRGIPAAATVHIPGFTKAMARKLAGLIDETLTELANGRSDGDDGDGRPRRARRKDAGATSPAA